MKIMIKYLVFLFNLVFAQFNAEVYETNNFGTKRLNPSIVIDQNTTTETTRFIQSINLDLRE